MSEGDGPEFHMVFSNPDDEARAALNQRLIVGTLAIGEGWTYPRRVLHRHRGTARVAASLLPADSSPHEHGPTKEEVMAAPGASLLQICPCGATNDGSGWEEGSRWAVGDRFNSLFMALSTCTFIFGGLDWVLTDLGATRWFLRQPGLTVFLVLVILRFLYAPLEQFWYWVLTGGNDAHLNWKDQERVSRNYDHIVERLNDQAFIIRTRRDLMNERWNEGSE